MSIDDLREVPTAQVANSLHLESIMPAMRNIGFSAIAIACVLVSVSPTRRRAMARKLADARRFVSRRIVDEDARASSRGMDRWESEGGAAPAPSEADDTQHAAEVSPPR